MIGGVAEPDPNTAAVTKPPVPVPPDPRWQRMAGDRDDLAAVAAEWRTDPAVPEPVAEMLATARRLFVHGYFVYEFHVVAVAWSLFAVEAALRDRLDAGRGPRKPGMAKLVGRALEAGLLTEEEADSLRAGVELRNGFAHPGGQVVHSPGMAAALVGSSHAAVADLYRREPTGET